MCVCVCLFVCCVLCVVLAPCVKVSDEVPEEKRHKMTTLFHVLFKGLAILVYLFANWISWNFVVSFVAIVLLVSFDFWTVKNISGRLLVGLRWWNEVDEEDGSNRWIFESRPDGKNVNAYEANIFWYVRGSSTTPAH